MNGGGLKNAPSGSRMGSPMGSGLGFIGAILLAALIVYALFRLFK